MFADDGKLHTADQTVESISNPLQDGLNTVAGWWNANKMEPHPMKTIIHVGHVPPSTSMSTATVALWLRRPLREREVVGSIPGRVIAKTLKLAF